MGVHSAQAIQHLEDEHHQTTNQCSDYLNKPVLPKQETASQTSPDVYKESTEVFTNTSGHNKINIPSEESGENVLENALCQKHEELSVLLLEMKETQEEIVYLKSQLQVSKADGDPEINHQKAVKEREDEGIHPVKTEILLENTAQHLPLILKEETSVTAFENEVQMNITHKHGIAEEAASDDPAADEADTVPPEVPVICQCHKDELENLKCQVLELETNHSQAAEIYKKSLDEKVKEIFHLTQLIEEYQKKAENANNEFTVLNKERDQLLSQVKESGITELRTRVQQLEVDLAEADNQKRLDYENHTTLHNLLTEQIQSLNIETRGKDMKIEALQNELDDMQLKLSQQSTLIKSIQKEKESELLERVEHERGLSNKVGELVQIVSVQDLQLQEKKREVEVLQKAIEEKDQEVTEKTEKMLQLKEEKFSLGVEIETLKEQLSLLSRAEETKMKQVAEGKEMVSDLKPKLDEPSPSELVSTEELQHELHLVRTESAQRKRKLQAALLSRKELLQRVSRLEEELAQVKDASGNEDDKSNMDENKESKEDPEKCMASKCKQVETILRQAISDREAELDHVKRDLEEKIVAEMQLQDMFKQVNQNLEEKGTQIDLLQAEILEKQAVIQKLTLGIKGAGDGDFVVPVKETVMSSPPGMENEEHGQTGQEEEISGLEKAKEHLSKMLQEVLTSRKDIFKTAQEKEKQLREELKQCKQVQTSLRVAISEKEEELEQVRKHLEERAVAEKQLEPVVISGSQEKTDVQSKENEKIGDQLEEQQVQVREPVHRNPVGTDQKEPDSPIRGSERFVTAMEQQPAQLVSESDLSPAWPPCPSDSNVMQIQAQPKEIEAKKEVSSTTSELTKKSEELLQLHEQIAKQGFQIHAASHESTVQAESLRQMCEDYQIEMAGLEHLIDLQPAIGAVRNLISKKEEEARYLSEQLIEREAALVKVQMQVMEQDDLIKSLHTKLEMQSKEHDEKIHKLELEYCEVKQKLHDNEASKADQKTKRKLQAALISRRDLLKANNSVQEELALARENIEQLKKALADGEGHISAQNKEKELIIKKLALFQEERDKLITEMDKSLLENQSLNRSFENLKLVLEGLTEDKKNLLQEMESLKCSKIAESNEWQAKHAELQKEYEVLLQSYENVSNEAERIQHVVETVKQEKRELYGKLRHTEAQKTEKEKQLQEAEKEIGEMKEKMRKFAKSKQLKILELEEENEQLRAEVHPAGGPPNDCMEALRSSNSNMKEDLERVKTEYETLSKEFEALMTEKDILSKEVQNLKHHMEGNVSKQIKLELIEENDYQMSITEEVIQAGPDEAHEQDYQSMNTGPDNSELVLPENNIKPEKCENDEINNYLQHIDHLKQKITELEQEREKEKEFILILENERTELLNTVTAKDDEFKMLQEQLTKINLLYQQIQEELMRVTKLKETAEADKDDLEERLMNQLAELNGSIGNYHQDVTDAQIKNDFLKSEVQNLKKCVCELQEEKQLLLKEKSQEGLVTQKDYLETIQGAQKEPNDKTYTKELHELLKEKQQELKQMQKDCIRYQEKISALEKTVKALEFVQSESQKDLEISKGKLAQADEHRKQAEIELASFKILLDDTQSEAARVLADNLKLKKELQANKELVKSQMKQKDEDLERRLEQAEERHLKEKKNTQERLDALYREKVHWEETFGEMQNSLNGKDKVVKLLQENLDSTTAQLTACTESMSSLQYDRERLIDEAKIWERKFSDVMQSKEEEMRINEENVSVLKDQLSQMSIHTEELKINISRLEHEKQIWESKAQTEIQKQQRVCDSLQAENKELLSRLEETRHQYSISQAELAKMESELNILSDQLKEQNNLQQEYLEINQEITESHPLTAQFQEYQDNTKKFHIMQEKVGEENLSWQQELHQLRVEKKNWEIHERRMKDQYLMALSDKDQQLIRLQNLMREWRPSSQTEIVRNQYQRQASLETTPPDLSQNLVYETEVLRSQLNDSLKEIHQKELRIQQLNSKFSQLLEEKNTLSIQLADTSQSLRENQQQYSNLFNHCAVLEMRIQELQMESSSTDVVTSVPLSESDSHGKNNPGEQKEIPVSIPEAHYQFTNTQQKINELRKLLEEERDQRVAAESALSLAEEQIRRLEHNEWNSAQTPLISSHDSQEQSLFINMPESTYRRFRNRPGWKRILRSLCNSRARGPILATIYFVLIHILLVLCFTGHL
ncbi:PREDICTED: golgin subfamily B member 1 isoform X1 [Condylura cristata]|nr:PREDICTED: golgin subfamily B member 1 isoform X1 [Condylura cristata]